MFIVPPAGRSLDSRAKTPLDQARFHGVSEANTSFFAVCVYAAPLKFVTLTYRDFRPNFTEEARGRQASESVASFRVK